jgi:hypothetical protein
MVARAMKMTIHPHLVPGLRMDGAILPLHTFSRHAEGYLYIYLFHQNLPTVLTA